MRSCTRYTALVTAMYARCDGSVWRHGEREGGEREFGDRDQWRSCAVYLSAVHASPVSVTAAIVFVTVASASRKS